MKKIFNLSYPVSFNSLINLIIIIIVVFSLSCSISAIPNEVENGGDNNLYSVSTINEDNFNAITKNIQNTWIDGNIIITSGLGNYIHPQITTDDKDNIIVAYTQEINSNDCRLGWSYSLNSGETWMAIEHSNQSFNTYNDIAWIDGDYYTGFMGVYNNLAEDFESFYKISDISDPKSWEFMHWSNKAKDLTYTCISDHGWLKGQYYETEGPVSFDLQYFLYTDYQLQDCPTSIIYGFTEEGCIDSGEITFDGQKYLKTVPAYDPDMSNEYMKSHYTWQYYNKTRGINQIVWKKIVPIEGDLESTDIEYTPFRKYIDDGEHPSITHDGNKVVIVYMEDGEQIKCSYSQDDGESWTIKTIAEGAWPDICSSGGIFRCAYAHEGNLYVIESIDSGANWSSPIQVNELDGTVVEEENSIDIHCGGIVWTGEIYGKKEIFYAPNRDIPKIQINDISLGLGVTVEIENIGYNDAHDIDCEIYISAPLMFIGEKTTFMIDVPQSDIVSISTGFVFGFGPASILVKAENIKSEKTGILFGPIFI